jgi:hypothetical protein
MNKRLAGGMVLVLSAAMLSCSLPLRAETLPQGRGTDTHGDPLPPGAIARLGTLRFRHGQPINGIAWSPDGKAVVSTGRGGSIVFHEASTGKATRRRNDSRSAAATPSERG